MTESRYVLVVDDDADMVAVIQNLLEAGGYASKGAANGQDALGVAAAAKPALVLLDMMMPIMNGWDCAYELRRRYGRALPIVIVTAAEHAEAWRAEVGADAVLAKPFEATRLLGIIETYVGSPSRP